MLKSCVSLEALSFGHFSTPSSTILSSLFQNLKRLNYLYLHFLISEPEQVRIYQYFLFLQWWNLGQLKAHCCLCFLHQNRRPTWTRHSAGPARLFLSPDSKNYYQSNVPTIKIKISNVLGQKKIVTFLKRFSIIKIANDLQFCNGHFTKKYFNPSICHWLHTRKFPLFTKMNKTH